MRRLSAAAAIASALGLLLGAPADAPAKKPRRISVKVTKLVWPATFHTGVPFRIKVTIRNSGIRLHKLPVVTGFSTPQAPSSFVEPDNNVNVTLPAHRTTTFNLRFFYKPGLTRPAGPATVEVIVIPSFSKEAQSPEFALVHVKDSRLVSRTPSTFLG
jgi:hypothetical protein